MTKLVQPLKWPGGKHYLAPKIIDMMPKHIHYVEPYFGGGAVMMAKNPQGVSEVANDIDGDLMNFWTVLRNGDLFPVFARACQGTPFSEELWGMVTEEIMKNGGANDSFLSECEPAKRAWLFFVACRTSMSGRMKDFAPLTRRRTRGGMNEQASAWLGAVDGLPAVHERLRRVIVLNHDAIDVIRQQDGKDTLFYLDPPYLHETRSTKNEYGVNEMSTEQHERLLSTLRCVKGKFMLSGYDSEMYSKIANLSGWNRHDFNLPNNAAGGKKKRRMIESVWCNF